MITSPDNRLEVPTAIAGSANAESGGGIPDLDRLLSLSAPEWRHRCALLLRSNDPTDLRLAIMCHNWALELEGEPAVRMLASDPMIVFAGKGPE